MKHKFPLTILLVAAATSTSSFAEDLTVISNVVTNGKPSGTETSYLSNDHIRRSESKGTDMIIDLKTGTMTNIDMNKKTYYLVTRSDMEAMQAKMTERMNDPKMKQVMAAMQGMSTSMAESAEVKKTGVSRQVGKYSCEEWSIKMGGMMTTTECVTNDFKFPAQSWAALADFNASMRKSMGGFGASAKSGEDLAEKMKSIKGFPVATKTTVDAGVMKTVISSEVTQVSHDSLPASTWEVPQGYKLVESPMMRSMQEHGR